MARYAGQKRRATTTSIYAIGDYDKCLKDAKRIHKEEKEFYVYKVDDKIWSSVSISDLVVDLSRMDEHWKQNEITNRWCRL
jgi:hypothetical protein